MGNKLYEENDVAAIATAIRTKNGSSNTYTVSQMAAAVEAIPTSGIISVTSVAINTYSGTTQTMYLKPDGSAGKMELSVSATVLPANATIPDIKWESSDPTKATIVYDEANNTYKVRAVGTGTVTISATSVENSDATDSFTVNVATPTWAVIKQFTQAGNILNLMDVGDIVPTVVDFKKTSSSHTTYNTGVRLVHVLDTAAKQAKYGLNSHGAIFQYQHAFVQGMMYDAAETALEATEETAQADIYYYGWVSGSTYTPLNLTTGDTIPYGDYTKVYKSSINTTGTYYNQIRGNGWNNWKYSMIRQWLNSDAAASSQEWFTPSHVGDGSPNNTVKNYAGWLADIDQDLAAVVAQATISTAANNVTDGGATYTTTDKFFLPSKQEVYFNPEVANAEGEAWDYYKDNVGYTSPNDGNSATRMFITYPTSSSPYNVVYWWLRSAYRSNAYVAWCGYGYGYAYNTSAGSAYYVAPACIIA